MFELFKQTIAQRHEKRMAAEYAAETEEIYKRIERKEYFMGLSEDGYRYDVINICDYWNNRVVLYYRTNGLWREIYIPDTRSWEHDDTDQIELIYKRYGAIWVSFRGNPDRGGRMYELYKKGYVEDTSYTIVSADEIRSLLEEVCNDYETKDEMADELSEINSGYDAIGNLIEQIDAVAKYNNADAHNNMMVDLINDSELYEDGEFIADEVLADAETGFIPKEGDRRNRLINWVSSGKAAKTYITLTALIRSGMLKTTNFVDRIMNKMKSSINLLACSRVEIMRRAYNEEGFPNNVKPPLMIRNFKCEWSY